MLAPICLFTYNRINETEQTVKALQRNFLALESDLFIFSDGSKNEKNRLKVEAVRKYIHQISGFKSVTIIESTVNKGLANSIIEGVTQIIEKQGKVIVLEDDLITTPNFLNFMNQALDFFENNNKIFNISGYTIDLPSLKEYNNDYYLGYRASSWGWATWFDRWNNVDWNSNGWQKTLINPVSHFRFMRGGSDMPLMLWKQMTGKIDSWAIRYCFQQFCNDQLTIFPRISKVNNIGFGGNATHTKNKKYWKINIDDSNQMLFSFNERNELNKKLIREFKRSHSFIERIKNNVK